MRMQPIGWAVLALAVSSWGCASGGRRCAVSCAPCPPVAAAVRAQVVPAAWRAEAVALMDVARSRSAYLPMASEADARASIPSMERFPVVPNLVRIAAAMPKTMEAEMAAWQALRQEGTIDRKLLGEVFWVVSRSNACGHCMGHIVFSTQLEEVPLEQVFEVEAPGNLDARRRATFAFARKVSRTPEKVTAADVASLRPHFTDAQIVELIFAVNRYRTMNTLAEAFGSPLETVNVFDPKNRVDPVAPKEGSEPPAAAPADAEPPAPEADAGT